MKRHVINIICTFFVLSIIINSQVTANEASLGYIPSEVETATDVPFHATLTNNFNDTEIYVKEMVIELIQDLSSVNTVQRFNYTKSYNSLNQRIEINSSFTDIFNVNLDVDPAAYNVSIWFTSANGSVASSNQNPITYANINQTMIVVGSNTFTSVIRVVAALIVTFFILFIIVNFINNRRK